MINMQQGRIIKIISNQYTIQNEKEEIIAKPRGKMRQHEAPVVGDFVEYEKIEDSYRIHKILPRTNRLLRPAIANVDQALIVTSLKDPDYSCHLLNRLIFLVGLAGVKPVICVTKLDLLDQPEEILADLEKYKKAGYDVVFSNPGSDDKELQEILNGKVPYEKCEKCDRTAYQKAKEKCDNRKSQLEKKFKNMTTGYESILFLLAWYSITITLFTAILSPVFLNDCITFFGVLGKGMGSLFREFVIGADSFGQLSSGIPNRILSGLMYWLIVAIVMGILFIITGLLIVGIGYQVGKIYRKYCWDILSIIVAITSAAIVIYFGEWIKSVIPVNLITLLLLVHVIYIGIRCYVKDWQEERGYY